jgi:hypothetical protein
MNYQNQGKRPQQIKDSEKFTFIAIIAIVVLVIIAKILDM